MELNSGKHDFSYFLKWKPRLINTISRALYLLHILILPSSLAVPLSLSHAVPFSHFGLSQSLAFLHTVPLSRSGLSQSPAFLHVVPLSLRSSSQSHIV